MLVFNFNDEEARLFFYVSANIELLQARAGLNYITVYMRSFFGS